MSNNKSLAQCMQQFADIVITGVYTDKQANELKAEQALNRILLYLSNTKQQQRAVYLVGNGGSAGIVSHALTDFINMAGLRAFTLHDISLLTCMANDYGYEQVYAQSLKTLIQNQDILLAVSSSGQSKNILNAVDAAKKVGATVVTFSGFSADNPLRQQGDINLWLNSCNYGFVELGHAFILHNIADRLH